MALLKKCDLKGLSTESKPINGIATGSTFTETDTGAVYTFNLNKGKWVCTGEIEKPEEAPCVGIYSINLFKTEGLVDTYKITYTNGASTTFTVTNGEDIEINRGLGKSPLIKDKIYTLDLVGEGRDKFQLYKSLHLDKATLNDDGAIISEALSTDYFWPRTEDGKFLLSVKDKKLELVFNYAGKNGNSNETWQAFAIDQNNEFIRYVGRFYWTDVQDQANSTYYFKAVPQTISFKTLTERIDVLSARIEAEKNRAKGIEVDLQKQIDDLDSTGLEKRCKDYTDEEIKKVNDTIATEDTTLKKYTDDNCKKLHDDFADNFDNLDVRVTANTKTITDINEKIIYVYTFDDRLTKAENDIIDNTNDIIQETATRISEDIAIEDELHDTRDAIYQKIDLTENSLETKIEKVDTTLNEKIDEQVELLKKDATDKANNALSDAKSYTNTTDANRKEYVDEKDNGLNNAINTERVARQTADADLQSQLTSHISTYNENRVNGIKISQSAKTTDGWDGKVEVVLLQDGAPKFDATSINLPTEDMIKKIDTVVGEDFTFEYSPVSNSETKTKIVLDSSAMTKNINDFKSDYTKKTNELTESILATRADCNKVHSELYDMKDQVTENTEDISKLKTDLDNKATYIKKYNSLSDLGISIGSKTKEALRDEIEASLDSTIISVNKNDYVWVEVVDLLGSVELIRRVERYYYDGNNWRFDFEVGTAEGMTQAQLTAINSNITAEKVAGYDLLDNKKQNKELKTGSTSEYKVLTDNNFTTELKTKLEGLAIDTELSKTSENAIANKPVATKLEALTQENTELKEKIATLTTFLNALQADVDTLFLAHGATSSIVRVINDDGDTALAVTEDGKTVNLIVRKA